MSILGRHARPHRGGHHEITVVPRRVRRLPAVRDAGRRRGSPGAGVGGAGEQPRRAQADVREGLRQQDRPRARNLRSAGEAGRRRRDRRSHHLDRRRHRRPDQGRQGGARLPRRHRPLRDRRCGQGRRAEARHFDPAGAQGAALLAAKSVAYTDPKSGGASGIHFVKVLADLGIADAVNAKAKLGQGGLTGEFIVKGEADMAVQQLPELKSVPGIDIVGPLPDALQSITLLSSGVLAGAKGPDTARALVAFLRSPEAVAVIKDKGLEPGGPGAKGAI